MLSTGQQPETQQQLPVQSINIENALNQSANVSAKRNKCRNCQEIWSLVISIIGKLLFLCDLTLLICLLTLFHPGMKERFVNAAGRGFPTPIGLELDCSFTLQTIIDKLDPFLLFHFMTHFTLTMAIRNRLFNWMASINWEILETIYASVPAFGFTGILLKKII